ncbi:hypothetical protein P280DRAFT_472370 [Massarina eburnea CBS 473.64]|uniref:IGFBP N-terminal domain-containing protein n=1 Tax=Massarina eburnea CBS 473.64 TaxID=1395130 RepID=A0A6A6RQ15_9PLEO|nr:hypothetical protein P280DRAFT_472370 [Massarina eburnea CBS 473.64]
MLIITKLFIFLLPLARATIPQPTQPPKYTVPCSGSPTIPPFTSSTPTPSVSTICTVGDDRLCPTGATCTPTMTCTPGTACGGACIFPPLPPFTSSTPSPSSTICTVGDDRPCPTGATCTPTMTCTPGRACGGACIATPLPPFTSLQTPVPTGYRKKCWHGKCGYGARCVNGWCIEKGF